MGAWLCICIHSLHSKPVFSISCRIPEAEVLPDLKVQFLLVMMKTQHSYLAQSLVQEVGEVHLGHLVMLLNLVKVKLQQEEGVGAEVPIT